ncbi:MAG: hypothetical protein K6F73_04625 [Lachnospiraceae bacterium]|nr:hypothetical protein [Lachnospiraceae bacterium]
MASPAIVAIAYNRPEPLKRLLSSIEAAYYPEGVSPALVVSIDNSGSDEVANAAREFTYTHGEKVIIERKERMGLKNHVLACGDLTEEYGSIIVLEDDLFVAPCFYEYACKALESAEKDDRIGSVSLYSHLFNVHVREGFIPVDDGFDNWYLQIASSWGQAYTRKQWESFRSWYADNKDRDLAGINVPANISGWSEKSWLKYYITYLIETGKYTIYPRVGLTTNFGDVGTHACRSDSDLQVPVQCSESPRCRFSTIDESRAVYDAFFEPLGIMDGENPVLGSYGKAGADTETGTDKEALIVDLYGYKPIAQMIDAAKAEGAQKVYVLTPKLLPYETVRSYGRQMRPVASNISYGVKGNDIHLYDVSKSAAAPVKEPEALEFLYEYRGISVKRMMKIIRYRILEKFGRS